MNVNTVSLSGGAVTLYALLMVLGGIAAALNVIAPARSGVKRGQAALLCILSAFLGVFLGRLIYCAVQADWIFYDPLGEYLGLSPFFDLAQGNVSMPGVLAGCMLSALLAASAFKGKAYFFLDAAALPGVFLFAFARLIEPLSGQGFGDVVEAEQWQFFPVMLENGAFAVCFLEALLALAAGVTAWAWRKKLRRRGSLFLTVLTLLSAGQIIPESLRRDEFLTIFTFARVNQIAFALFLGLALLLALLRGKKRGLSTGKAVLEFALLLLGVGVLIAGEFALDKTFISHLLIYAVMLLTLILISALILRRVRIEDKMRKKYV